MTRDIIFFISLYLRKALLKLNINKKANIKYPIKSNEGINVLWEY